MIEYGTNILPSFPRNSMCISKAEKFYEMLAALLRRRGKNDFAIRIEHKASAGRGVLPYGPQGPGGWLY